MPLPTPEVGRCDHPPHSIAMTRHDHPLQHRWRSARLSPGALPAYEDVVLGNLGRFADGSATVVRDPEGQLAFLWGGEGFERWLGCGQPVRELRIDALPLGDAKTLAALVNDAFRTGEPATARRNQVHDGVVDSDAVLALPLARRLGPPCVLLHVLADQRTRTSLVDAIFQATNQGMLALATVRDEAGTPVDFQIVALNDGAARLMQRPADELIWRRLSRVLPSLGRDDALARLQRAVAEGERDAFEFTYRPDTTDQPIYLRVGVGSIGDLIALTLTDIGEVKQREASYRLLFEGNPVPMWLFDLETLRFLDVNAAAVAHYGYARERFLTMTLFDIRPPEDWPALREAAADRERLNGAEMLWRHLKADGTAIEVTVYARPVTYRERPAILVAAIDVTERRRAEARVAHLAHHDALTDLPNRVLFRERLAEALATAKAGAPDRRASAQSRRGGSPERSGQLAVLCIDLDGFKSVNDMLGHPVGDELLREVAHRLQASLRETDMAARFGGDEFAVLQTALASPEDAAALAARIVEGLSQPYFLSGQEVIVGASVGIAIAPGDADTPDVLLRNADMALYRAKAEGRRTFRFFEAGMDARLQARRALERDLRHAFAQGGLELHFQPLMGVEQGQVTGCEALLRWRHPDHGFVSPADFVPLAEDIGLIGPIGEWVLQEACREAATWPASVNIAVNLSPAQFRQGVNLVQAVVLALARSGLAPSRLELEITESVLLADSEANVEILHRLRSLGVRVAMDDFGTGYSSLSYLRSFPFDKIKIDQSFVRELGASPHCAAIIKAVTGLGASLGITTTAEGVETEAQLQQLRADGCDEVQGFLFSRPLPAQEARRFLAQATSLAEGGAAAPAGDRAEAA